MKAGVLVLLVGVVLSASNTPLVQSQDVQIEGWVYDTAGTGLSGVQITVDQQGKITGPKDTDGNGHYTVAVAAGRAISKITYNHSRFEPGVVPNLSEKRNHSISKVLYSPGEPRGTAAHVEQLAAYEHLLLTIADGIPDPTTTAIVTRVARGKYIDLLPVEKVPQLRVQEVLQKHKQLLIVEYARFADGGRGR